VTGDDLYRRGSETAAASWEAYARGAPGATVRRLPGVAVAVFPDEPQRSVYNNAILERGLDGAGRARALDAMEAAYAAAGVTRFAAWVHESDLPMRAHLEARGYTLDTSTRAMGMALSDITSPRPAIDLAPPRWADYLHYLGLVGISPELLRDVAADAFHLLIARVDGEHVATALSFDHEEDCGVYNVSTLEHARRHGLGTARTALPVHDAIARGRLTATLQSTPMAERVYGDVGFRDLGRILEFVPQEHAPTDDPDRARA
jgi:GNAT superfamily N-acetyltransferase